MLDTYFTRRVNTWEGSGSEPVRDMDIVSHSNAENDCVGILGMSPGRRGMEDE